MDQGNKGCAPRYEPDLSLLLAKAREGDARAFGDLVEQLGDRLWRSALIMCRDEHAAHDLVQECWIEAWKHRTRFDGRCSYTTWLHGILRHRYWKLVRRNTRKPLTLRADAVPSEWTESLQPEPAAVLEQHERHAAVRRALAVLPEDQRRVVELRFFADASLADIAEVLDCPEGTVKSRLHHALRKLRKHPETVNLPRTGGESGATP